MSLVQNSGRMHGSRVSATISSNNNKMQMKKMMNVMKMNVMKTITMKAMSKMKEKSMIMTTEAPEVLKTIINDPKNISESDEMIAKVINKEEMKMTATMKVPEVLKNVTEPNETNAMTTTMKPAPEAHKTVIKEPKNIPKPDSMIMEVLDDNEMMMKAMMAAPRCLRMLMNPTRGPR